MSQRHRPLRIAGLASGGGRTLVNLAEHIAAGSLDAQIVTAIASNESAERKMRGRGLDLPVQVADRKAFEDVDAFSDALFEMIREADAELVCLCGFLCLIRIPDDFAQRVINIHPALLPAFGGQGMYGHHVHEAVLAHGCKVSGCTVHFADQTYDTGPIIVQRCVPVHEDDTPDKLAARVFEQECIAYPEAVQRIAEGRVRIEGQRTVIDP